MSSLSPEAYAVIEGRHSDPFHYLGPHLEGGVPIVRVFLPDAEGVAIVDEHGHESDLQRIHDAGLYQGPMTNGSQRYRLRARYGDQQVEIEDAYRFPPILSEVDLYLLGEGTHMHLYEKLGARPMVLEGVAGVAFAVLRLPPGGSASSAISTYGMEDAMRCAFAATASGKSSCPKPAPATSTSTRSSARTATCCR
jgi:1,4-alpha-glucan branching enzyme